MSVFRFLPGIIIIQAATAVLVFAVAETPEANWPLYGLFVLMASLMTALWFASIANHIKKDALARLREEFMREREQFLVTAEQEKNKVFEQTQQRIVKETNRAHAKANFKVGATVVGAAGVAIGLLSIQFITIGLMMLLTAGGVLTGYLVRARQDALAHGEKEVKPILARRRPMELIKAKTSESVSP